MTKFNTDNTNILPSFSVRVGCGAHTIPTTALAGGRTRFTALSAGVAAEGVTDGTDRNPGLQPPTAGPIAPSGAGVTASRGENIPDIPGRKMREGRREVSCTKVRIFEAYQAEVSAWRVLTIQK